MRSQFKRDPDGIGWPERNPGPNHADGYEDDANKLVQALVDIHPQRPQVDVVYAKPGRSELLIPMFLHDLGEREEVTRHLMI